MFILDPNKQYPTETESRVVIRFQDCDPLRHLNNAKYFDYFFNAREDQVPKIYGVEMKDFILSYDAVWVVYNHHIAYLKPANMGEWVKINSRVVWFNENTLVVEYCMFDDSKSYLKTLMWTTFKYVGMNTSRTVEHSEEVSAYLKAILYPNVDYHPHKFDDRVQQVKNLLRPTI
ncbi:MAG: thioesterase [Cytophagales bacterium CG12_big_fil_rev_8_21_14_0_65_40_12]|nr:MAG: thioesterase [Cytophagales bacterium CG12_big_fil_rev_8_21_14_0_65_40_12]PIW05887.1 MAG: thioesterase [Cytophagales bacterium CG17_big_fil_post_rev_8_21_14_2_50_40_13]